MDSKAEQKVTNSNRLEESVHVLTSNLAKPMTEPPSNHDANTCSNKLDASNNALKSNLDNPIPDTSSIHDTNTCSNALNESIHALKLSMNNQMPASSTIQDTNSNKHDNSNQVLNSRLDKPRPIKSRRPQKTSNDICPFVAWKSDVNLDAPAALGKEVPADIKHAQGYYHDLQWTLFETGYPETVDRTDKPRTEQTDEEVTVLILSAPDECIGLLLEGGKQCPDTFVHILSSSWIKKLPCGDNSYDLYAYKGLTFSRGGTSYIDEYNPPRRCTYLLNFFTASISGGQRNDGVEIEKDLDCPMSSSVELAAKIDDKVWTTCIMAEVGMGFPELLAFRYRPKHAIPVCEEKHIRILELEDKTKGYEIMAEEVELFLNQPFMQGIEQIVVKPSGPMFFGSLGVTIHRSENRSEILQAAIDLLRDLEPDCSILVESFFQPIKARETGNVTTEFHSQQFGFRSRANVCRDFANKPKMTLVTCGVNNKDNPINGSNTVRQSLDTTLLSFGITDPAEKQKLVDDMARKSEAMLQYIIDHEALHKDNRKTRAMTDVIGLDLVVTNTPDGGLSFGGIEVNSHDCIINCFKLEFIESMAGKEPKCFQTNVQNMVTRSQKYLMEDKQVLVVGSGGFSKRHIYGDMKQNGVKVIIVDSTPPHEEAVDSVVKYIQYDCTDHSLDLVHARNIANKLRSQGIRVDGCLTFWDDCVPLAAAVNELLELNGSFYEAASSAKQKSKTHSVLLQRDADIPHWPRTYHYASKVQTITCHKDLANIEKRVTFPCILKLEHGSSAVGVSLCTSKNDIVTQYNQLHGVLKTEEDFPGIGLGFGNDMMVMNYWEGTEHDVDIVIYNRRLVTAIVTDNGPTSRRSFAETSACMPSGLPIDKQGQLITAAYQCCTEIGLESGVFNVEMKMTARGPRLIEINARMGGFYIREWVKYLYGFDLAAAAMMIACDIKPFLFKLDPKKTIMGVMLLPSVHQDILTAEGSLEQLREMHVNKEIIFVEFTERTAEMTDFYEEPVANVAVVGDSVSDCKEKLTEICQRFRITTEEYNVDTFIGGFL